MLAPLSKIECTEDSTYPAHSFLCARYAHVDIMIFIRATTPIVRAAYVMIYVQLVCLAY
jgi:hypothetical protein